MLDASSPRFCWCPEIFYWTHGHTWTFWRPVWKKSPLHISVTSLAISIRLVTRCTNVGGSQLQCLQNSLPEYRWGYSGKPNFWEGWEMHPEPWSASHCTAAHNPACHENFTQVILSLTVRVASSDNKIFLHFKKTHHLWSLVISCFLLRCFSFTWSSVCWSSRGSSGWHASL